MVLHINQFSFPDRFQSGKAKSQDVLRPVYTCDFGAIFVALFNTTFDRDQVAVLKSPV